MKFRWSNFFFSYRGIIMKLSSERGNLTQKFQNFISKLLSFSSPFCLFLRCNGGFELNSVITNQEGRKSMLKLAERMVISFCAGVSASTTHTWTTLSGTGADDVRVMTRKSIDDPGRPPGIVLSAATSFWLPVPPKRIFDFLRDENSRSEVSKFTITYQYHISH